MGDFCHCLPQLWTTSLPRSRMRLRITAAQEDLQGTQEKLDAVLAHCDKLKPSRVDACIS